MEKSEPKISVVISTYERRRELKRCLKSVLNQSFRDFEVIVVDDRSTYSVGKLCSSFRDSRIKFFRTEENCGHDGKPKNLGILKARGKWVAFLDDDDCYRPDALKVLQAYAEASGADAVYGDYVNVQGKDRKPGWSIDFSPARLSVHNYISMCTTLIRREALLDVGGFDEAVPRFKDWNLWLRLHKAGYLFYHVSVPVTDAYASERSVSVRYPVEADHNGVLKPTYFNPADCLIYPEKSSLGETKPLSAAVYTLTDGRLEYLKKMSRLLDLTAGYPFDWYVVDDASSDGTRQWLLKESKRKGKWRRKMFVMRHDDKKGLAESWNDALDLVGDGYDLTVKLDDDAMCLTKGWLKVFADIFARNRRLLLSMRVEGLEGAPGGVLRRRPDGSSPYALVNDTVLGLVPHIGGICLAAPGKFWKGYRVPTEGEGNRDLLVCQHAAQSGYSCHYVEEYGVLHGPKGTLGQKEDYPDRKDSITVHKYDGQKENRS